MNVKNFLGTRWGIISVGAFIGMLVPLLQKFENPGNMGVCVACFERDMDDLPLDFSRCLKYGSINCEWRQKPSLLSIGSDQKGSH